MKLFLLFNQDGGLFFFFFLSNGGKNVSTTSVPHFLPFLPANALKSLLTLSTGGFSLTFRLGVVS